MQLRSMTASLLSVRDSLRTATVEPFEAADAKGIVLQFFQEAVNEGWAERKINADGQEEVHFQSGEVFLLLENTVSRLK
jgi:hypothetical protein